ncbi:MAG: S8 family serine peptidase [Defluviitaleaceae bacterium]|nr:S8 family serine peptidase [Defluviitaleaceae bacterium]
MTELIIKYTGDVVAAIKALDAIVEILSGRFAIITIDEDKIPYLEDLSGIDYIEHPKSIWLNMTESLYHACIRQAVNAFGLTGKGVAVAIIDSGIDYTHPDFRNADGTTRIKYLWDMSATGTPPEGFESGHLYTEEQFNAALATANPLGIIPQIDTIGHGTAVAGVAVGNGAASGGVEKGVAPEADIIAVKLGQGSKTTDLMRALKFVADTAKKLDIPVTVNISFGTNEGAHDDNSLFEQYVDEIAQSPKMSIAVAAGNEGSAGHHFSGNLPTGESEVVEFSVGAGLRRLYIVLWKDFADEFTIEIVTPLGKTTGVVRNVDHEKTVTLDGAKIHIDMGQPTHHEPDQMIYVDITTSATQDTIIPGHWKLIITSTHSVVGDYNIWLPTTEEVGRDTAFTRPNPNATITIPATAANVISVGAYDASRDSYAEFSGRGFEELPRTRPDIVAPGVNILAASAGGGYDTYSGTSIAAPFVTGAAALLMQWGIIQGNDADLYGQRLKAYLHLGASRDANRTYPNELWGYGTLCLKTTLDYLKDFEIKDVDAMASTNQVDYEAITLAEYAIMPGIIDIIMTNDEAFRTYAATRPYIKIGTLVDGTWAVAYLPEDKLPNLLRNLSLSTIRVLPRLFGLLGKSSLIASGILQVQQRPYLDLKGRGVLIGFIDTGIEYAHQAFRYEDGTSKIATIWDQTAQHISGSNVFIGREYNKEEINDALKNDYPLDVLPHRDTVGHGTFLASVAASREESDYLGAAPDSEIIMVKLRKAKEFYLNRYNIPPEQENAYSSSDILLGIKYLADKAAELKRPLAICMSVGTTLGSHDGLSIVEEYLSNLGKAPGIAVCVAAGNEANTKRHTQNKIAKAGDIVPVEIRVGENVPSATAYIWSLPQDTIYISVKSPTGEIVTKQTAFREEFYSQKLVLEKSTVNINYFFPVGGSGSDLIELIIDIPTPGIWTVNIQASIVLDGTIHIWMPLTGFMSDQVEFITPTPNYTITMPGTGLGVITCGAYDPKNNSLYPASSWGPTRFPIVSPELAAPGVNVLGIYPTGYGEMSGTSVATAITAGAAALMLQWGVVDGNYPSLNNLRIRSFLVQGCDRDANMSYPNDQWGYGRLNLMQTFNILRG